MEAYIIGINAHDKSIGNETITTGRDLPWLQDDSAVDVWTLWDVEYRDVYILDEENKLVAVYNLSLNDLNQESAYNDLYNIILMHND